MKVLKKIDDLIVRLLKIVSSTCMGAMVILVLIEVLFRYVLKMSCAWAEELARLALVWCVVLSSAVGIRLMEHPRIELIFNRFPATVRLILEVIIYLVIAAFGVVLLIYGAKFSAATKIDYMTSLGYPKNFFYLPAAVGGAFYTLYSLIHIGETISAHKNNKGEGRS